MRIVIPVTGSRGDLQPYIALGKGLRAIGHQVRIATHADFAATVLSEGIEFAAIAGSSCALHNTEGAWRMTRAGRNPFVYLRELIRLREPFFNDLLSRTAEACRDGGLVLLTQTTLLVGMSAAEKWGLPYIITSLQPTGPSRHLPNCLFPELPTWLPGRGAYNYLSHLVAGGYIWLQLRSLLNKARLAVLDLPPLPFCGPPVSLFEETPALVGYSRRVIPPPPDWGKNIQVTGFWFLDAPSSWHPPADLVDFLESGEAPVCLGFGSMTDGDAEQATEVALKALDATGLRAVMLTGWGGLCGRSLSDRVFVARSVPHDWLFPRSAAVIHHGGAGTTAAALRAGVPALVVPFSGDQFLWGRRVFSLGLGPRPIPRRALSVERLTGALRALTENSSLQRRASEFGAAIRAEDGVGQAVRVLTESGLGRRQTGLNTRRFSA